VQSEQNRGHSQSASLHAHKNDDEAAIFKLHSPYQPTGDQPQAIEALVKGFKEGNEYMGIALGDEHGVDPCMNTVSNHLIMASYGCVVIILHNHPSLSKFSLDDVKFFLRNNTVKMMVVVTNLGSISYLVKKDNYEHKTAVELYNESVNRHNEGSGLRDYQKAVEYFLSNCKMANIVYDDR
jgi:excinuclease UvrABC helicase subunit UvrB